MLLVLFGFYLGISLVVFVGVSFFVALGGRASELWRPFVYAVGWPVMLIFAVARALAGEEDHL